MGVLIMNLSKRMQLGLLALVCLVVVISGCTSNNTNNSTASSSNMSNSTNSSSNTSSSSASSSSDVNIVVKYTGNWAIDISGNFPYRGTSGTGDQTINLGSVSGPVTVSARKTEGGSGTLTVSIEKGGKNLSTSSTSSPYGAATAYFTV